MIVTCIQLAISLTLSAFTYHVAGSEISWVSSLPVGEADGAFEVVDRVTCAKSVCAPVHVCVQFLMLPMCALP